MTAREFATMMLQIGSWICLVSALLVPVYVITSSSLLWDELTRLVAAAAWAVNGVVWWAGLATIGWISDEVRELHHEINRATKD